MEDCPDKKVFKKGKVTNVKIKLVGGFEFVLNEVSEISHELNGFSKLEDVEFTIYHEDGFYLKVENVEKFNFEMEGLEYEAHPKYGFFIKY